MNGVPIGVDVKLFDIFILAEKGCNPLLLFGCKEAIAAVM